LLEIVNDVLDFSKIEAGHFELAPAPFSLEQALGATLRTFALRAERNGLAFSCLDESSLDVSLVGDAGRLQQVLVNLLGNAVKFTEHGSVSLHVGVASRETGRVVLRFTIRDTGIGIPVERQPRIFEAFAQADASISRVYGGTGLGLAICKRLVERMEGRIWFESEPGTGTGFFVELPFGCIVQPTAVPESSAAEGTLVAAEGLRVLVIEDNATNRLIVHRLLEKRGHEVIEADSASMGIELAARDPPDLVLLDIQLPGTSGYEVLARLRALPGPASRLPVIAVTAHALAGDRERCIAAGMDGYVAKPFTAQSLIQEMNRVVAHTGSESRRADPEASAAAHRFAMAIQGIDGDMELFAEVATKVADDYIRFSTRIAELARKGDLPTLAAEAHKINGSWSHYAAPEDEQLGTVLQRAAREGDVVTSRDAAARLGAALSGVAQELRAWLSLRTPGKKT
jgi:CheY-like chemotaxis protein